MKKLAPTLIALSLAGMASFAGAQSSTRNMKTDDVKDQPAAVSTPGVNARADVKADAKDATNLRPQNQMKSEPGSAKADPSKKAHLPTTAEKSKREDVKADLKASGKVETDPNSNLRNLPNSDKPVK